jgi:uncharacterized RDD family membrane protein YckC
VTDSHDAAISQQGHYAGAVTRLAGYAVDQALATASFSLGVGVVVFLVSLVSDIEINTSFNQVAVSLSYLAWLFLYYSYPWSVSGKSPGMALVGIRVVASDGSPTSPRHGIVRTLAFPLGFLTLGIGFLGIVFGRQHRALYDVIADTAVVYDWDARGARWRFLARQSEERAAIARPAGKTLRRRAGEPETA